MTTSKQKPKKKKKTATGPLIMWAGLAVAVAAISLLLYSYLHLNRQKPLAEFNGGKVTKEDFFKVLRLEISKYDPIIWKDETQALRIKKDILSDLIKEKILLEKAKAAGIKSTDEETSLILESFKSGYTESTFRKMLDLKGIKYDDWAKKKKDKHLVQKLITAEVIDKIQIDPKEIKKYYDEHKKEFTHPEQVRVRHILTSSWDEAAKIARELSDGANFAAIAKNRSISPERWKGGDLGYIERGTHPEVFDRVCFNLPVGEVSQIVKSEYGYHIFKVTEKRKPTNETLDEATPYITSILKGLQSEDAFNKWFAPILESASIKINGEMLKQIEVTFDENDYS